MNLYTPDSNLTLIPRWLMVGRVATADIDRTSAAVE